MVLLRILAGPLLCAFLLVTGSSGKAPHFIDLSHWLDEKSPTFPQHQPFNMTIQAMTGLKNLPVTVQSEILVMSTHFGTHIDSPVHMCETGWKLHEIPPQNLDGPGVVISMKRKAHSNHNYAITKRDIRRFEKKYGDIPNRGIVLFNTGWSHKWKNPGEFLGTESKDISLIRHPGLGKDAAEYLVKKRNIVGIGLDTVSYDVGNSTTYDSHIILSAANKWGLENVANLNRVPPIGCYIYVFPLKLIGASGSPARVVAFCDDAHRALNNVV